MTRVLFVWFKQPRAINDGGSKANMRSLNAIEQMVGKKNVDIYYIHPLGEKRHTLSKVADAWYTLSYHHNGITPRHIRTIANMAKDYDYVFLSSSVFGIVAKELKEQNYKGKIIVHFHNVESIYYDAILPKWLPGRQLVIRCAEKNDEYSCQYADSISVLTERDNNYIEEHYHRRADIIIPISLPDRCNDLQKGQQTDSRPRCAFIGGNFPPNREGLLWFIRNVLPHVDIRFKVVGRNMARLKEEYKEMRDIEVVNSVPDLKPYFEETDFMVLPIFSGSGMKVKTCESLMYGRNIIGSDETFEGYDLDASKVGSRCNTAEEFIAAIKHFAEHPVPKFNAYSRSVYLSKYSDSVVVENYRKLFL